MVYSQMPVGPDGIAHAIPVILTKPSAEDIHAWRFEFAQPIRCCRMGLSEISPFSLIGFPPCIAPSRSALPFQDYSVTEDEDAIR